MEETWMDEKWYVVEWKGNAEWKGNDIVSHGAYEAEMFQTQEEALKLYEKLLLDFQMGKIKGLWLRYADIDYHDSYEETGDWELGDYITLAGVGEEM